MQTHTPTGRQGEGEGGGGEEGLMETSLRFSFNGGTAKNCIEYKAP